MNKKNYLWSMFTMLMVAIMSAAFVSCNKDYTAFVGTWGVEKIEYYNIDYAGDPIPASYSSFDPNSFQQISSSCLISSIVSCSSLNIF